MVARNAGTGASRWVLRELTRIGSLDGEGPDVFGRIVDAEIGPSGDVFVLDAQAGEVRVFRIDGEHQRTFGSEGEGPGELNRASGLAFDPSGTLWVMNIGNARYSAYDPSSGDLVREERRMASFFMIPFPGAFDADGRLLDVGLGGTDYEPVLLRLDDQFAPRDTLPMPTPDDGSRIAWMRDGVMMMSSMDPFASQPAWGPTADGGLVIGEGSTYRWHRVGFDGDTTLTVEVDRDRIAVTSSERDSALAEFEELKAEFEAEPEREPRVPDYKPAHGSVFEDDQGRIWVRVTTNSDQAVWDVFSADGRLLGQVSGDIPSTYATPAIAGNTFAIHAQPSGIPTVFVYAVEPAP